MHGFQTTANYNYTIWYLVNYVDNIIRLDHIRSYFPIVDPSLI